MKNIFNKNLSKVSLFIFSLLFIIVTSLFLSNSVNAVTYVTVSTYSSYGGSITRGGGSTPVSFSNGVYTFKSGDSTSFIVSPDYGYCISGFYIDGSPVGSGIYGCGSYYPGWIPITSSHSIEVYFIEKPIITASSGAGGSISPAGSTTYDYLLSQYYSINPDSGYEVSNVLVDGVSQGAISGYAFYYIDTNHTISATFSPIPITVTVYATPSNIPNNTTSKIDWYSTGATYCIPPVGYESAGTGTTGFFTTRSLTATTTFTVECFN